MRYEPLSIYLAGKIDQNDWRHSIVAGLREHIAQGDSSYESWPIMRNAIYGVHHYTGPFFISTDHGTAHGANSHGYGMNDPMFINPFGYKHVGDDHLQRSATTRLCLQAIDDADIVFAYIESESAYGTLVEIGYAIGRGKKVYINEARDFSEHWFSHHAPNVTYLPGRDMHGALRHAIGISSKPVTDPPLSNPNHKFVYLLRSQGVFKIGVTQSIPQRISQLQTANPYQIELVAYAETSTYAQLEATLHAAFADKRTSGEWFRLDWREVEDVKRQLAESDQRSWLRVQS